MKCLIVIFISWVTINLGSSQPILSPDLEYHIRCSTQKNISIASIFHFKKVYKRENFSPRNDIYSFLDFPGFGYLPGELDHQISKVELNYPDTSWQLFKLAFSDTPQNDTLSKWSFGTMTLNSYKNILIGINKNGDIKYISGCYFHHPIAKDFKLTKDTPNSYLPFLRLKFYGNQFDTIEFSRRENKKLIFVGSKIEEGVLCAINEFFIDPQNPDKISSKFIGKPKYSPVRSRPKLKFKDFEDKKRYLLNALMKNMYMYRMLHFPDFEERLNVDFSTWFFKEGSSDMDSLLPNYDEYWNRIEPVTFYLLRDTKKNCPNVWPDFQKGLLTVGNHKVVGNLMFDGLEFYRFYKDTLETFSRRPGKYKKSGGYYKYDYYYHPEEKKKYDEWIEKNGFPPPPPEPMPDFLHHFGGNPKCLPYNLPFSQKWKQRMDYYLLALDTKTREVYFISGKDIYLTKAIHLYPPVNKELPISVKDWKLPYKLAYIKDRLYRYQVSTVTEENIIIQDEEKIVLEVTGSEYGKALKLKVTFNNDDPELLIIDKLPH